MNVLHFAHDICMAWRQSSTSYQGIMMSLLASHKEGFFSQIDRAIGKIKPCDLDCITKIQAHHYICSF